MFQLTSTALYFLVQCVVFELTFLNYHILTLYYFE